MKLTRKQLRILIREFRDTSLIDNNIKIDWGEEILPQEKNIIALYCFSAYVPMPTNKWASDNMSADEKLLYYYFKSEKDMLMCLESDIEIDSLSELPLLPLTSIYNPGFGDPTLIEMQAKIKDMFCEENVDSIVVYNHSSDRDTHFKWSSISAKNRHSWPTEVIKYQLIPQVITINCN